MSTFLGVGNAEQTFPIAALLFNHHQHAAHSGGFCSDSQLVPLQTEPSHILYFSHIFSPQNCLVPWENRCPFQRKDTSFCRNKSKF